MKTYRIRYTIVDGEHPYADEMIVSDKAMTDQRAVRHIAECWLPGATPQYRQLFRRVLLREGFAFLPGGERGIKGMTWEEILPITITISHGLIENVINIPAGQHVEIRDWDAAEFDENGEPVPDVTVWDGDDFEIR